MKVLLGWELGAGQGHIQRLVALAHRLSQQGCTPVFALKSYNLKGMDFPWQSLVAPRLPFTGREDSHTFADLLASFGFDDASLLQPHIHQWQDILKTVNPDLVVTDHAPGLVLAAHGLLPTVVVGSHFAVPPPTEIFPIFRLPASPDTDLRQQAVSETVHQIVRQDAPLGQILNGDRSFIFSIPELDHYRGWRDPNTDYVGIHITPLKLGGDTIGDSAALHAWAYLGGDYPFRDLVLETLNPDSGFKPLQEALTNTAIALHHGGLTTTVACVLAGVPQLILPRYIEQQLNAIALLRLGIGQMLTAPNWEHLLMAQAEVLSLSNNAQALAHQLAHWNQDHLDKVVQTCLQFLR
ncbi:hypothetical protein H6G89_05625 [Oscillatoria sp. FACHB-1407]|uniref:glycosyltransferase n=1 Tax=Oscillatoria sp. FACHB-1407 TaxID=2692847 RepID=UPI00168804FA|nr:nucleotide disphospho-sugar-binding domain-containing protein [Oscillatoria sp. FACHB-1407]MBD2460520.1 hypothetical protein [Oscillatoria sp. FACHB-1407]